MTRRPTIRDVAAAAGVSTVTVSRVVNASGLVQPATRLRVEAAMRELDYVPNVAARAMRTSATRSIGCILPDLVNFPNAAIAQAAERALAAAGYSLLLAMSDYDIEAELRAIEVLRTRQVDGLLLYVTDERAPSLHQALRALDAPVLVLDRTLPIEADELLTDHATAMREAVDHLAGLGHRRLAFLGLDLAIRPVIERRRGFRRAVRAAGLAEADSQVVAVAPGDLERPEQAAAVLDAVRGPTGIITDGSRLTRSVIVAARQRGRAIPRDLSLIGIDVADIAQAATPPLTAIGRDYARIGRTAAELLLERLAAPGAPPRRTTLGSEIVRRGSCGPPSGD